MPDERSVPLCGNSIGTDRRFLAAYLPEIEEFLHYRSVDVSSVKELCRRWYPDVLSHRGWKQGSHRALDDIRESVSELRMYREFVFRSPDLVTEALAVATAADPAAPAETAAAGDAAADTAPDATA